ncbi:MAG: hypothetical protein ACRCUG_04685 [Yersinia sp. (in: enterobacteria)]
MDDSLPDFACFVRPEARFDDQLCIRQQVNGEKKVNKTVEKSFLDIKKPGETPGFYR